MIIPLFGQQEANATITKHQIHAINIYTTR